jgi:hypothetical protein
MKKSSYELDLSNARDEAKDQIRRLCERVCTWADGMTRGCAREFEVNWIFRPPPGTAPLGPYITELAQRLVRNDYDIESLTILVCRRPRKSGGIFSGTPYKPEPQSDLLKVSAASGCYAWLHSRYPRLADEFLSEWLELRDKGVE